MSKVTVEDVQGWIECDKGNITRSQKNLDSGFYERENVPIESHYSGQGLSYAQMARSYAYLGDFEQARASFRLAAENTAKPFFMIYDANDPDHHRIRPDYSEVSETNCMEAINYALCANDLAQARTIAKIWQNPGDGVLKHAPINRFIHALTYCLLDRSADAVPLLQETLEWFQARKLSKKLTWQLNFYTLSLALYGIAKQDQTLFNDGLELQLEFHKRYARYGEIHDTPEALVSDNCIALANLALLQGLNVTIKDPMIPEALLQINAPL
ncbi:Imm49 family immunity protein [Amphritea pacifica]|uniref:Immunity 49 family protein n=1 Tax=Amphritea pacifica TaxID=2811233 RepID=A0ABS2W4U9_9GAMM|nr:Imm49 family immunity protein [Amphritea pacifica]MBN0986733.1 immunity 49 family protein [Amphritea pacifica]